MPAKPPRAHAALPSPAMFNLPEPPTEATLYSARLELSSQLTQLSSISSRIESAESVLAELVSSSRRTIAALVAERAELEDRVFRTKAYIAPIRRLPDELLRTVFDEAFEDYPCIAWILSSVCTLWRRLALAMPAIWRKIRLITTQQSSADTIRLWLERSGSQVPLDVEIFLRVNTTDKHDTLANTPPLRHRASSPSAWPLPLTIPVTIPHHPLPPAHTPIIVPPSPPSGWSSPPYPGTSPLPTNEKNVPKMNIHWGHIAIFYLVEQMHRWERFVFRFDKQFSSMSALKSITGDAPLLREFEVSCAEPAFYTDWPWLPSAPSSTSPDITRLTSLTLQYTPFKWSSPILRAPLTTLTLRALPTSHLPLDRILHIISANPALRTLSLHFTAVLPAVLPLSPTSVPELKSLSLGGHYLLAQLADSLILPSLDSLSLDIEARDAIEDTIANLLTRSNHPPLASLSVAYDGSKSPSFYFGPGGVIISWTFLAELAHLHTLRVGGTPFEPLLGALGTPGDDQDSWMCPALTTLSMKNCHAHGDGVSKLVHMVDARNPDAGGLGLSFGGTIPVRLRTLELYECASVGVDVLSWLKGRIQEVICTEPVYERQVVLAI